MIFWYPGTLVLPTCKLEGRETVCPGNGSWDILYPELTLRNCLYLVTAEVNWCHISTKLGMYFMFLNVKDLIK